MGSSGSKAAAGDPSSSRSCCYRCRNKSGSGGGGSGSGVRSPHSSCSCLGLLRTHESHNHLLLLGVEEEEKKDSTGNAAQTTTTENDDDEDNMHNNQVLIKKTDDDHVVGIGNDNTTRSSSSAISTPLPPPRFSFIPSNFSLRLTRAASFGSSTRLPTVDHPSPSPFPSPPHNHQIDNNISFVPHQHHHHHTRDPVERTVRFSRTLSVGRLRDRVLRRSDGLFARQPTPPTPNISSLSSTHPLPTMPSNSIYNTQDFHPEMQRPREARYHDIVEHRTDFLERRRRIRSQVRALQRLGSRFENLSGHERSCILAGQYRSGRCTCRTSNRTRNLDDDTSARASISRIVMLAEALFEVLDEIHQQSVVLSSRSFVSSLGSIPAPREVVDSMPVKIYTKLQKHQFEYVSQCYICLLEYEEGDCMRILPCHHEFHKTCIDKWLKEIHRVCPLCRGDVCQSNSLSPED